MFNRSLIALACMACLVAPVSAQPPGEEFYGWFRQPVLWCKSQEDLKTLLDARYRDPAESTALYTVYHQEVDARGYPRCGLNQVGPVQVGKVNIDYGVVNNGDEYAHGWMVDVGNSSLEFWIFYMEPAGKRS